MRWGPLVINSKEKECSSGRRAHRPTSLAATPTANGGSLDDSAKGEKLHSFVAHPTVVLLSPEAAEIDDDDDVNDGRLQDDEPKEVTI